MSARSIGRMAVTTLAAASLGLAGCAIPTTPRPQIVLVHGAWMGAAAWDAVATDLRSRGHPVTAVELPGHGRDDTPAEQLTLARYVEAVNAALRGPGRAVLVGHSMAGMVISAAAEQQPQRIARLVYVAAYLPRSGESLYQLSQQDKDSRVGAYWTQQDPARYTPATIRREGIVEVFCADCPPAQQQFLLATHKPEAIAPLGTPVTLTATAFGSVPRTYVHTTKDMAVSYALQKTMLANAGGAAQVVTLETSHSPMLSMPKALADAIDAAAR